MNNAPYLDLLEEARWDLITRNGYGLDEIKRRQAGPTSPRASRAPNLA